MIKILDCTLRDGGYYTDWKFEDNLVQEYLSSMSKAPVDIIELGYKSPNGGEKYKACKEDDLSPLVSQFNLKDKLCFMLDAKDFDNKNLDVAFEDANIVEQSESLFSWVRVAVKSFQVDLGIKIVNKLKSLGYENIGFNLMGVSLLPVEDIKDIAHNISEANLGLKALYFADSFGSLTPADISAIATGMQSKYKGNIGFHAHANMGLELANAMMAKSSGVNFIDVTMTGMGRGAGNLKTEQFLLYLEHDISDMLPALEHFEALKARYGWGWNVGYMHSGMKSVHPLYGQEIYSRKYPVSTSFNLIKDIVKRDLKSFNKENIPSMNAAVVIPVRLKSNRFQGKPLAKILGREMVLRVADISAKAVGINNVYVATDSEQIKNVVEGAGYKVIMTGQALTGTDRVAEAATQIDADIIVNVQGDEPLLDPNVITQVIESKSQNFDHVINCYAELADFQDKNSLSIPKVVVSEDSKLLYMSRATIPSSKSGVSGPLKKQVCVYGYSKSDLASFKSDRKPEVEDSEDIEILRFLEKGVPVHMIRVSDVNTHAVDYETDIEVVESILKERENS